MIQSCLRKFEGISVIYSFIVSGRNIEKRFKQNRNCKTAANSYRSIWREAKIFYCKFHRRTRTKSLLPQDGAVSCLVLQYSIHVKLR